MRFEEKITVYFSKLTVELKDVPPLYESPSRHLLHLYADYVELMVVFLNRNYLSASDVLDRLKDEGLIRQTAKDEDQANENDNNQKFVEGIFRLMRERSYLFGEDYPFLFRDHDKMILKAKGELSQRNKLYIFLLLSSSLNLFNPFQPELTKEFEEVCFHALKNFLPSHAVVKAFGKNSEYSGTAMEKIRELAAELNIPIDDDALEQISTRGVQERGLDLIGWIPFNDQVPNLLTILAQCACGKEWYNKKNETERYNRYFKFHCHYPIHSMFIPYSLIDYNKNILYQNDECHDRLIFERNRILNFVEDTGFFDSMNSKLLVEKCIEYEEDVV